MKTRKISNHMRVIGVLAVAVLGIQGAALAATVNATYNSAADVPVTANGYMATSNTVNFALNFAPETGTDLMVVQDTALDFIVGTFDNLGQGQEVALSYGGVTYRFVANYYGGSGNDLVLVWGSNRAFAWGENQYGQIGDNSNADRQAPVPVTTTGVLAGKTVVTLAAGFRHSVALCSDGTVAAWGNNSTGELGDDTTTPHLVAVAVNAAPEVSVLNAKTVVAVAVGSSHNLALCSDGTVASWGYNHHGELGDSTTANRLAPVAVNTNSGVSALYGKKVVAIAAGAYHSLALCSDGTVAAWGYNDLGQLGDNTWALTRYVPVAVSTNSGVSALYGKKVVAIAAGNRHSLALCSDGTLAAWGDNQYGELGDNRASGSYSRAPVAVGIDTNSALHSETVVAIAAGGTHNLALCSDGTLAAWGYNEPGQLGDNTTTWRFVPVVVNTNSGVSALHGKTVVAIAAGHYHSLAQCSDGTMTAWGRNDSGQLGDNTTTQRRVAVAVNTMTLGVGQRACWIFAGPISYHTLALVAGPPASPITLAAAQMLTNSSFRFAFTNTPGAFFGVVAATDAALPLSNWTSLTGLTELSPGQFQFTDSQATNNPGRLYRVRSP